MNSFTLRPIRMMVKDDSVQFNQSDSHIIDYSGVSVSDADHCHLWLVWSHSTLWNGLPIEVVRLVARWMRRKTIRYSKGAIVAINYRLYQEEEEEELPVECTCHLIEPKWLDTSLDVDHYYQIFQDQLPGPLKRFYVDISQFKNRVKLLNMLWHAAGGHYRGPGMVKRDGNAYWEVGADTFDREAGANAVEAGWIDTFQNVVIGANLSSGITRACPFAYDRAKNQVGSFERAIRPIYLPMIDAYWREEWPSNDDEE